MSRLILIAVFLASEIAVSQTELLPAGIGLFQYGYRSYRTQTHKYNRNGKLESLGEEFDKSFSGPDLLNEDEGSDLNRLAKELQRYDTDPESPDSLSNAINLGHLRGNIAANVSAQIFGLAYGLSEAVTIFAGVPYVKSSVDLDLKIVGANNASQINENLGSLAYNELRDGLDRAAAFSVDDVRQEITDKGYELPDHWHHSGIGDTLVGFKTGRIWRPARRHAYGVTLTPSLSIPTGYVQKPSILTDLSTGKGHYILGLGINQNWTIRRNYFLLSETGYFHHFNSKRKVRVPVGEENLVDQDREINATHNPGDSFNQAIGTGFHYRFAGLAYVLGKARKFGDRYRGSIDGNYAKLERDSDESQTYSEWRLSFDTFNLFRRKKFFYPLKIDFTAHKILDAENSFQEDYFEIKFTGLFSTPAYEN